MNRVIERPGLPLLAKTGLRFNAVQRMLLYVATSVLVHGLRFIPTD